jgi:hypothetical protein
MYMADMAVTKYTVRLLLAVLRYVSIEASNSCLAQSALITGTGGTFYGCLTLTLPARRGFHIYPGSINMGRLHQHKYPMLTMNTLMPLRQY